MKEIYREYYRMLGLNIAFYRGKKQWGQEQLCDLIGIEQSHLSKIENGRVGISLDLLFAIAEAVNVESSRLLEIRE